MASSAAGVEDHGRGTCRIPQSCDLAELRRGRCSGVEEKDLVGGVVFTLPFVEIDSIDDCALTVRIARGFSGVLCM